MEIELGKPYRMFRFPKAKHAKEYCENHGFYLGCSCVPIEFTNWGKIDGEESAPISVDVEGEIMVMNCGVAFFEDHFKLDYRIMNLNKLLNVEK